MCALLSFPGGATQGQLQKRLAAAGSPIDRRVFYIQLGRLLETGLVKGERQEKGKGRPWRYWSTVTREQLVGQTLESIFDFLPLLPEDRALVLDLFDSRVGVAELAEASSGS